MLPSFFTSKPVSRVLSFKTAIYLDVRLPARSSRLLNTTGPIMCVPTALLRIEFTASRCSHVMGELLPRLSTLTSSAQAPNHSLRRMRQSSLSSLRLLSPQKHLLLRGPQWGEAVSLLHFSWGHPRRALPVILALRSPDFPHRRAFRPAHAAVQLTCPIIIEEKGRGVKCFLAYCDF